MYEREPESWIVFSHQGRELARISAAEATFDEPGETAALLAHEMGCAFDQIDIAREEV